MDKRDKGLLDRLVHRRGGGTEVFLLGIQVVLHLRQADIGILALQCKRVLQGLDAQPEDMEENVGAPDDAPPHWWEWYIRPDGGEFWLEGPLVSLLLSREWVQCLYDQVDIIRHRILRSDEEDKSALQNYWFEKELSQTLAPAYCDTCREIELQQHGHLLDGNAHVVACHRAGCDHEALVRDYPCTSN
jgi:hypothetical protein